MYVQFVSLVYNLRNHFHPQKSCFLNLCNICHLLIIVLFSVLVLCFLFYLICMHVICDSLYLLKGRLLEQIIAHEPSNTKPTACFFKIMFYCYKTTPNLSHIIYAYFRSIIANLVAGDTNHTVQTKIFLF